MKITWVSIKDKDKYKNAYKEISKLRNPKRKDFIPTKEIKEFASSNNIDEEEAENILNYRNNKEPYYTDMNKVNSLSMLALKQTAELTNYFINNEAITGEQHLSEDFNGVPVFDNEWYITLTEDTWNRLVKAAKEEKENRYV